MRLFRAFLCAILAAPPADVAGGSRLPAGPGDYSSVVLIRVYTGISDAYYENCTGVMVGRGAVLTAGHCFFDPTLPKEITADFAERPDLVSVWAGPDFNDRADNAEASQPIALQALKISLHPSWKSQSEDRLDLALIRIEPVNGLRSEAISPAVPKDGDPILIVGFGNSDEAGIGRKRSGTAAVAGKSAAALKIVDAEDISAGDSGAPVLAGIGEDFGVVGIVSQAGFPDGSVLASRLDRRWIARQLSEWEDAPAPETGLMTLELLRAQSRTNAFLSSAGLGQ